MVNPNPRGEVRGIEGPAPRGRGFVEARGRFAAYLASESEAGELWFWPLEVAHGLRIRSPRVLGQEVLEAGPCKLRVAHRTSNGILETLAYVPEGERAFLWEFRWRPAERSAPPAAEPSTEEPANLALELEFTAVLRPQWPAGLGGTFARLEQHAEPFDLLLLGEELGRFAVAVGAPGFTVRPANLDHALPRNPIVLRARLDPLPDAPSNRDSAPGLALVFAGAHVDPPPLDEAARLGDVGAAEGLARTRGATEAALALHRRMLDRAHGMLAGDERRWAERRSSLARTRTDNDARDLAFLRAREAIQRAQVEVHGLGRGLVAGLAPSLGSSRPGFGWFFDGDAMIAGRALVLCGARDEARDVLDFAASHQREDGKLLHELSLSAGLCPWFEEYPYAWYKANNTPAFLIDLAHHLRVTGDLNFARKHLSACRRALAWCATVRTPEGLLSNRLAGLCAVEAGPLQGRIEAEIYLQGLWLAALEAARQLAEAIDDGEWAREASSLLDDACGAFESFWDEDRGVHTFAHLRDGSRFHEVSAFTAYPLARAPLDRIRGEPDRARRTAAHFNHPRLACDWGVRFFPVDGEVYDPEHYNTGSVFPYISLYPILALYRTGLAPAAWQLLSGLFALDGFEAEGFVPEHLVGDRCATPPRGVPHQIFSSSALVQGWIEGTFGYAPRAERDELHWGPRVPASWRTAALDRLCFRDGTVDLALGVEVRGSSRVLTYRITESTAKPFTLHLAPELPPHTRVLGCRIGGEATAKFTVDTAGSTTIVELPPLELPRLELTAAMWVELHVVLGPEPQAPPPTLTWGRPPRDLRLVDCTVEESGLRWLVAGPPGTEHRIDLEGDRPCRILGATRGDDGRLIVQLPGVQGGDDPVTPPWVEHTLEFRVEAEAIPEGCDG